MTDAGANWVLLSLAPVPRERVEAWFDGIAGLRIELPAERTAEAVRAAIGDADIVISDWSGALRVDRLEIAAAEHLAFLMSPSVGLDNVDLDDLTAAGVVVANTAGLNAPSVAEWCLAGGLRGRPLAGLGRRPCPGRGVAAVRAAGAGLDRARRTARRGRRVRSGREPRGEPVRRDRL